MTLLDSAAGATVPPINSSSGTCAAAKLALEKRENPKAPRAIQRAASETEFAGGDGGHSLSIRIFPSKKESVRRLDTLFCGLEGTAGILIKCGRRSDSGKDYPPTQLRSIADSGGYLQSAGSKVVAGSLGNFMGRKKMSRGLPTNSGLIPGKAQSHPPTSPFSRAARTAASMAESISSGVAMAPGVAMGALPVPTGSFPVATLAFPFPTGCFPEDGAGKSGRSENAVDRRMARFDSLAIR